MERVVKMDMNKDDISEMLKKLSLQDFLNVGLNQVAYIRRLDSTNKKPHDIYAVYAADGSQISVMDSYDTAIAAIRINDLFPITLH